MGFACRSIRCRGPSEGDLPVPSTNSIRSRPRAAPGVGMHAAGRQRPQRTRRAADARASPPAGARLEPPPSRRQRAANRRRGSSARRSASRPAAASCTSSCRRCDASRTTSSWWPPVEATARRSACACCSKAIRRPSDPRLAHFLRHARSRRDRGQHAAGRRTGMSSSSRRRALRRGAAGRPDDREVHARRPPHRHRRRQSLRARRRRRRQTARSCGVPICCEAWSPTGTTIRRCRISSRGCSSGRPARRRGSTKRGNDSLYEIEIAFSQLPRAGRADAAVARRSRAAPSAGGRHRQHASRRVLHRQALFAGLPAGRRGLLELRAFEMPPHARMSLAQQLLLRALDRAVLARAVPAAR